MFAAVPPSEQAMATLCQDGYESKRLPIWPLFCSLRTAFLLKILSQSCSALRHRCLSQFRVIALLSAGPFSPPALQLVRYSAEVLLKERWRIPDLTNSLSANLVLLIDAVFNGRVYTRSPPLASVIQSPLIHVMRCPVSPLSGPESE